MANRELISLTAITTAADDDIFYIVADPSGDAGDRKITKANVVKGLVVSGEGFVGGIIAQTTNYTLLTTDFTVLFDSTSGNLTATLPAAASNFGRIYHIKKTDASANLVIVDPNASETIDGSLTSSIASQYASIRIQSDGSNWHIL